MLNHLEIVSNKNTHYEYFKLWKHVCELTLLVWMKGVGILEKLNLHTEYTWKEHIHDNS